MSYRTLMIAAIAAISFALAPAAATAASAVTFVSTAGADAGTCARTAPCRTLAFAIGATSARGEIHVLDSGGYGASAIVNKSITIDGGGNSIFTLPIDINAATARVVLRDLVLDGAGTTN